jgi:hypothetical protein
VAGVLDCASLFLLLHRTKRKIEKESKFEATFPSVQTKGKKPSAIFITNEEYLVLFG